MVCIFFSDLLEAITDLKKVVVLEYQIAAFHDG